MLRIDGAEAHVLQNSMPIARMQRGCMGTGSSARNSTVLTVQGCRTGTGSSARVACSLELQEQPIYAPTI